jgi:hypothetical protein
MKKNVLISLILTLVISVVFAQKEVYHPSVIAKPVYFDVSPPLRDMALQAPTHSDKTWKDGIVLNRFNVKNKEAVHLPESGDPARQRTFGMLKTDTTIQNFDGTGNVNGYVPPDTYGDVGPNHYFQVVNAAYQIFSKTGASLLGPVNSSTVWNGMPNNSNDGDAVVLYDEQADRWLFSQFSLPNYPNGPFYQMIAVSQTPDPTGSWYRWQYTFTNMPDYPKFGVWPDGYYMSMNIFTGAGNYFGTGAVAYDRTAMLAGSAGAQMVLFTLPSTNEAFGLLPSDCDGPFPVAGTPAYYTYINESPAHLGIYEFHSDWVTPANATFGNFTTVPVQTYSSAITGIPQKGTTKKVDPITDRLMYRAQFRRFSDHQTIVTNHTVNAGSAVAGVRWYELRNTGSGWAMYQQGTYSPDANFRWMGSVAMDASGNMALGFSISSSTMYPSIRYTGRLSADPLNQLTVAEQGIINGGGSQTGGGVGVGRWGDYSSMTVDPSVPLTFWYTQEYYTSNSGSGWKTRIGSFSFVVPFSVAASATPARLCVGDTTHLTALALGNTGTVTYSWTSIPAGFTSTLQNPVVVPLVNTKYVVTAVNGTSTVTDTTNVQVLPAAVVSAGNDTTVCWYTVHYDVSGSVSTATHVQWTTSGDGTFVNDTLLSTTYNVGSNDRANGSVILTLTADPVAPCMNRVSNEKHILFDPCTGIEGIADQKFSLNIAPNPTGGIFTVSVNGAGNEKINVSVTDLSGKQVYSTVENVAGNILIKQINLSQFPKGVYFVKVSKGGESKSSKLVVE